jgi:tRNA threonylcarbamoyladenosine biosynthesis protein TsaB
MAIILHIDTASSSASVSLAKDGVIMDFIENNLPNEHASFLQPAVKKLLQDAGIILNEVNAIAVVNGPGSYTGLRVGLASAKGLAYASNKPLITIGTLPIMANAARVTVKDNSILYAPMMDARRMEVFTAVYDCEGNEKLSPQAKVLSRDSFVELLLRNKILFFGNGAAKYKEMTDHPNALFSTDYNIIQSFAQLSFIAYRKQHFAALAYCEPLYLKEFYTGN